MGNVIFPAPPSEINHIKNKLAERDREKGDFDTKLTQMVVLQSVDRSPDYRCDLLSSEMKQ